MPALEMAQETGKLLAWRKKEGDRVAKGEPLLEIETDKAVVEVEAPVDGVLAAIKAAEGAEIPVGQTIAWIVAPGEQPPTDDATSAAPSARAVAHAITEKKKSDVPPSVRPSGTVAKISPKARRLAKELGVEISALAGSGPDGEILASDVQAAAGQTFPSDQQQGKLEIPSTVGRIMAERTTQSWTSVPHFFVTRDIDATALNQYRDRILGEIESSHQVRVSHTDLLIALVGRALLKHPRVNASWKDGAIHLNPDVNVSVAMAVEGGVINAVIHGADRVALADISAKRQELTELARTNRLRPGDIAGGTFTISNLGMYKVEAFTAIIPPGQAAILAVGGITERVVAVGGKPAVRPMMTLTLSSDHRVIDGAQAALFLGEVVEAMGNPEKRLE